MKQIRLWILFKLKPKESGAWTYVFLNCARSGHPSITQTVTADTRKVQKWKQTQVLPSCHFSLRA